jgi:HK97 gp10 family phage protein
MAGLLGLEAMFAELDSVESRMKGPAAEETVKTVAEKAVQRMQDTAPVLTGELRDSIHAEPGSMPNGVAEDIVSDSDHAVYVEFGTSNMSAQPFWRPALHEAEAEFAGVAKETYQKHIPELH